MEILVPDINISQNRGGSWLTPPDQTSGNSYFIGSNLTDYERADLTTTANYRDSQLVNDWVAGSYVLGNIVRHGSSIFECVAATSAEPSKNTTTPWLWIAYSNKFGMLDGVLQNRTYGYSSTMGEFQDWEINLRTSAETIEYQRGDGVSEADSRASKINRLAFLNLYQVDTITVQLKKSDNTTVVFERSYSVGTYYLTGTVGATTYYDSPRDSTSNQEIGNSLIVEIPSIVGNGYLNITIGASGTNKMRGVGGIYTGRAIKIATANWGSSFDMTSFDVIEANRFGAYNFITRGYKNNFTYNLAIGTDTINGVRQILQRARSYPSVYIGDKDKQVTINYGIVKDFSPSLQYGTTITELEIMGV